MPRKISATLAVAGATLALSFSPALADGPPSTPPVRTADAAAPAPAQPQVAPAPAQAPVRAGPIQAPAQPQATAAAADAPPRTGAVTLASGAVSMNVPAGYLLYSPAEAQAYLQRVSAPAPRGEILGLLAPAGTRPTHQNFWGAVVAYEPIGHVSPDGGAALAAPGLADDVRAARTAAQRGFEGFAAQPAFDASAASLTWAERTAQPGPAVRDLRYEQRLLGRQGVVSFTSIGRSDQLSQIVAAAPATLQSASFPAGQRYADFAPGDTASRFDLAGLVTGRESATAQIASDAGPPGAPAPAQKQGFLGGAGLQGLFPWIAAGVVALAALGWFILGRRRRPEDDAEFPADERAGSGQAPTTT
jgi:uncharacterized membrane-anchored protein